MVTSAVKTTANTVRPYYVPVLRQHSLHVFFHLYNPTHWRATHRRTEIDFVINLLYPRELAGRKIYKLNSALEHSKHTGHWTILYICSSIKHASVHLSMHLSVHPCIHRLSTIHLLHHLPSPSSFLCQMLIIWKYSQGKEISCIQHMTNIYSSNWNIT